MPEVKIFILPVPRVSVQGRSSYTFSMLNGQEVNAQRTFARGVEKTFTFASNSEGTKLNTGLEEMVSNPYYQQDYNNVPVQIRPGSEWVSQYDSLKEREKIPLQTLYEIYDNVSDGTYNVKKSNVSMTSASALQLKEWRPSYLETFRIYLTDSTNVFSSNTSRGRLGIQLLKNHPKIASSKSTININQHDFYIAAENEAMEERSLKRNTVMDAIASLTNLKKEAEPFILYQLAVSLGIIRGNQSQSIVKDELDNWVFESKKLSGFTQEQRLQMFDTLMPMTTTVEGLDRLYIKYILKQAINERIIVHDKGTFLWPMKRGIENLFNLGTSKAGVETFLYNEMPNASAGIESSLAEIESELAKRQVEIRQYKPIVKIEDKIVKK